MTFAPLEGWRKAKVTDHHAAVDYAQVLEELSDVHFPDAKQIVLVQDNLSTHTAASLYAAFPPEEARRLAKRFEWHYTPKHGSWLDMAESELAVLTTQCLDRRIPDKTTLEKEVAAWQAHRNKHHAKADWQFTTNDARVKLERLYPQFRATRATSGQSPTLGARPGTSQRGGVRTLLHQIFAPRNPLIFLVSARSALILIYAPPGMSATARVQPLSC